MIILDTNVVSELMRGEDATPSVWSWRGRLDERPWVTVVTRAEIMAGLAYMSRGERRSALSASSRTVFATFAGILPFADDSVEAFAAIAASRRAIGLSAHLADMQIAAIALTYGAAVATRNVKDFAGIGLRLINPWDS